MIHRAVLSDQEEGKLYISKPGYQRLVATVHRFTPPSMSRCHQCISPPLRLSFFSNASHAASAPSSPMRRAVSVLPASDAAAARLLLSSMTSHRRRA
ncbi:hypothetical protein Ahy_B06g081241 isoform C [Arachis hypogaea]|uniref:Uncharacterized protein n=1 Tax=Arachis hypogaea TaxID=3818 RepID=A0A444YKL8_ARAHY|nr:hypothetical protein Ahy_B06g081241 isoform C [Arachis hypogaea]